MWGLYCALNAPFLALVPKVAHGSKMADEALPVTSMFPVEGRGKGMRKGEAGRRVYTFLETISNDFLTHVYHL